MSEYNSKYTGQQVEALLDIVSQGGNGGGGSGEVQKTTEAEILAMGFTKNTGTVTGVKMNGETKGTSGVVDLGTVLTEHQDISGKVDKVTGKGLSTEDFTTALKQKLEGLSNYDDTDISNAVSTLRTDLDKLVSGGGKEVVLTYDEMVSAEPNKVYIVPYPGAAGINLTIDFAETDANYEEFSVVFILARIGGGGGGISLVLPDNLKWPNGVAPTPELDKWMELNVVKIDVDGDVTWNAVLTVFE